LIHGVFNSAKETFNPDKRAILYQFNQGELLRKELSNIAGEISSIGNSYISISEVANVKTTTANNFLTPGRNLRIKKYKLKLAGDNSDVGVYFVNQTTSERIKVEASEIVTNNPSELIIVIPELAGGTYSLEVVSQYAGNNTSIKKRRTSVLNKTLTVQVS